MVLISTLIIEISNTSIQYTECDFVPYSNVAGKYYIVSWLINSDASYLHSFERYTREAGTVQYIVVPS